MGVEDDTPGSGVGLGLWSGDGLGGSDDGLPLGWSEGRGDGDPVDRWWWVRLGTGDEAAACGVVSGGEGPAGAVPLSPGPACGTPFRGAARRAAGLPGGWVTAGCATIAPPAGGSDSRDPPVDGPACRNSGV